jgi:phage baseplate assembly protein W
MAVPLGRKVVIDTEEYNDYAIGITLPIQIGQVAFNQSFVTSDQVESNLKNLLLTKKGERLMQPEFGCGLQELLFEQNDTGLETRIEDVINDAVGYWLPYININSIDIQSDPAQRDVNRINVNVSYTYGQNTTLNQITFTI